MEEFAKNFERVIRFELRGFFGKNKLQKFWRLTRTSYVLYNLLKSHGKQQSGEIRICDIGCGPGIVASFFAKRGFQVVGIDIVDPLISFARKFFAKLGLRGQFIIADITKQDPVFQSINADSIICIDAIEHFSDPAQSIQNFKRIITKGGTVFLTTPNFGNPIFTLIERSWDIVGKTPGWGHLHVTRLGLKQYKQLFENAGFIIQDAGTFMLVSPFIAIFSPKLARLASKLEQYVLRKLPVGFMLYITARVKKEKY
ncbi:MAG: class I SAM-dependent methyltransferase [Candidatus Lokiarchaeota archaeon]|nr:class I SAM-dependent methyltransferase [Candidatus Lokiarchaeota archaeon]